MPCLFPLSLSLSHFRSFVKASGLVCGKVRQQLLNYLLPILLNWNQGKAFRLKIRQNVDITLNRDLEHNNSQEKKTRKTNRRVFE